MLLTAITHELCPRCRAGKIFRGPLWRTYLATYERCPACNLKYEREQGYFLGAMYFSYLLSIPPVLGLMLLLWWLTSWGFNTVVAGGVPGVPAPGARGNAVCARAVALCRPALRP